jgi:hypothetical protein
VGVFAGNPHETPADDVVIAETVYQGVPVRRGKVTGVGSEDDHRQYRQDAL